MSLGGSSGVRRGAGRPGPDPAEPESDPAQGLPGPSCNSRTREPPSPLSRMGGAQQKKKL